jgi:hypothetical protein
MEYLPAFFRRTNKSWLMESIGEHGYAFGGSDGTAARKRSSGLYRGK